MMTDSTRIAEIEKDIAALKTQNFNWHSDAGCLAYLTELQREKNFLLQQLLLPTPAPGGGGLIGRAHSVQLNPGYPAATYNITSFREFATLPPRTASSLKLRIMRGPKNVRKRVAADIVDIERRTGTILRGYVRRTVNEYVEVVLVTAPTTEQELARLMTPLILRWPVDNDNIRFEQSNVVDAHFLDANKFQVLQANGEPEGFSNFFEETDAFTIVSSLR